MPHREQDHMLSYLISTLRTLIKCAFNLSLGRSTTARKLVLVCLGYFQTAPLLRETKIDYGRQAAPLGRSTALNPLNPCLSSATNLLLLMTTRLSQQCPVKWRQRPSTCCLRVSLSSNSEAKATWVARAPNNCQGSDPRRQCRSQTRTSSQSVCKYQ